MKQQIAKGSFYLVAVGMFLFTAYMTVAFMDSVIPNAPLLVKLATLLVFDGGMLVWLVVFTSYASGTTQRATAITTCLFDFVGVGLMVAAEIMTSQSNVTTELPIEEWATWAVAGWAVINVGAVLLFHLSDPETRKEMRKQSRHDKIFELAAKMLDEDLDREAMWYADQMRQREKSELLSSLNLKSAAMLPANNDDEGLAESFFTPPTVEAQPLSKVIEVAINTGDEATNTAESDENFTRPH